MGRSQLLSKSETLLVVIFQTPAAQGHDGGRLFHRSGFGHHPDQGCPQVHPPHPGQEATERECPLPGFWRRLPAFGGVFEAFAVCAFAVFFFSFFFFFLEQKLSCCGVLKLCVWHCMYTCICFCIYALFKQKICMCVCTYVCVCVGGVLQCTCCVCVCLNEHIGYVRTCEFWNAQCPLSHKSVAVLITSLTDAWNAIVLACYRRLLQRPCWSWPPSSTWASRAFQKRSVPSVE